MVKKGRLVARSRRCIWLRDDNQGRTVYATTSLGDIKRAPTVLTKAIDKRYARSGPFFSPSALPYKTTANKYSPFPPSQPHSPPVSLVSFPFSTLGQLMVPVINTSRIHAASVRPYPVLSRVSELLTIFPTIFSTFSMHSVHVHIHLFQTSFPLTQAFRGTQDGLKPPHHSRKVSS